MMPVASAVAQQEISQQQSLTLMRNMMRLYLSNVCHGRGLFPESDFERRDVCQLEGVPSLGHREGPVTAEAMRLLSWMEKGVFDALKLRYLDQCVLVVSDDEAAERVREAWVLKMEWTTDADGNYRLNTGADTFVVEITGVDDWAGEGRTNEYDGPDPIVVEGATQTPLAWEFLGTGSVYTNTSRLYNFSGVAATTSDVTESRTWPASRFRCASSK